MRKIRWGICGSGAIAGKFVSDLKMLQDAEVTAVYSREIENSLNFGKKFSIPNCYSDYSNFTSDNNIDVIYIGVPNNVHMDMSLSALESGKAVLCEKPFALNIDQVKKIISKAKKKNLFLMEALWSYFFPAMEKVKSIIDAGTIGDIKLLTGDFGFKADYDPKHRLFDPEKGGGALLDVGLYPVSLACKFLGNPKDIKAVAYITPSGVDAQNALVFRTENNQIAIMSSAIEVNTAMDAVITGTKGSIRLIYPWWKLSKFILKVENEEEKIIEMPYQGYGYHFEASAVMDCLNKGELENGTASHDFSLKIIKVMDEARKQMGVKYPGD